MENLHNHRGITNANTGPPRGFTDIFRRELGFSHPNAFARRFSASEVFSISLSHSVFIFFFLSKFLWLITANCQMFSLWLQICKIQYNSRNAKWKTYSVNQLLFVGLMFYNVCKLTLLRTLLYTQFISYITDFLEYFVNCWILFVWTFFFIDTEFAFCDFYIKKKKGCCSWTDKYFG